MIKSGDLLPEYQNFRQKYFAVFDIETAESLSENESILAVQKVISIGCATNIPGYGSKWFCRQSSSSKHGQDMVDDFMEYLEELQSGLQAFIPGEISNLIENLEIEVGDAKFSKWNAAKMGKISQLKSYKKLNVFGFNSGT